jgi:hypothetical protein
MAETLVLANFTIDSTGVVRAADVSSKAIGGVNNSIRQSEAVSKSALNWVSRLVIGYGAIGAVLMARRTAIDQFTAGLKDLTAESKRLGSTGLTAEFQQRLDRLGDSFGKIRMELVRIVTSTPQISSGLDAWSSLFTSIADQVVKMGPYLKALATIMLMSNGTSTKSVQPQTPFQNFLNTFDPNAPSGNKPTGWPSLRGGIGGNADIKGIRFDWEELDAAFAESDRIIRESLIPSLDDLGGSLATLSDTMTDVLANQNVMSESQQRWGEFFDFLQQGADKTNVAMDAFTVASSGIGNALAEGVISGQAAMKQAIAGMLADLSRMFFVRSIESLAVGILASTPYGQALGLGPPSTYYAASAEFAGAAILAGGAARAIGGGGGGGGAHGGGHGGGGGTRFTGAGSGGGTSIVVNLNGPTIGLDENRLARYLARVINKNQGDGAI